MLPWSDEKRKEYIKGQYYNYVRLIAARRGMETGNHIIDHFPGIYPLAEPFLYNGTRPILLEGFKLLDGSTLDPTFCELVTDVDAAKTADQMEQKNEISVKEIETEVNVCFEHISKTRYDLLRAREDLKNSQAELKMLEARVKFMRETEVPLTQQKVNNMQGSILSLEKQLKKILVEEK